MSNPEPRPALRRAADATVHPAAPHLAALRAELPPKPKGKGAKGASHVPFPGDGDKAVDLVVPLPKAMRKQLKARAAELGYTPEEAAFHLLRVWLDG
ncbi:hypothetical protein [Vallicoccus soli]|uniref:Uncharacterized protein n=1 Tax=Vallicoccus soli TaxID=2339232 RepID=A0A3A3Z335_9ACTN|nr:hypothetical protein [Vallicoccus soli]RJK97822.1 hypothetical protein D5H78_02240 [Vallicoccus soli]